MIGAAFRDCMTDVDGYLKDLRTFLGAPWPVLSDDDEEERLRLQGAIAGAQAAAEAADHAVLPSLRDFLDPR